MLEEAGSAKLEWPLGVVEEVLPSRDGLVRTVQVRTKKGSFIRSVPRIRLLELVSGDDAVLTTENTKFVVRSNVTDETDIDGMRDATDPHVDKADVVVANEPISYRTRAGRVSKPVQRL